jgi:hypothetical protein
MILKFFYPIPDEKAPPRGYNIALRHNPIGGDRELQPFLPK